MRILITNDDGVEAPGLHALEHIASEITKDVWVVAPETDNSGASIRSPWPNRSVCASSANPLCGQGNADRLRHHGSALLAA